MRPGDRLAGRYEIQGEAARGGMGTVYRALDRATRAQVAVKALADVEGVSGARFAREVAALQALSHPAIVRYLAHGPDYLVTEWLEGETLAASLARDGLAPAGALRACARVAEALAEAHRHGIVHRDIKPSNIILVAGDPERAKVVDFGIARTTEAGALTRTGVVVGTFGYLSPEQAVGSTIIDGRADLFALGCVLFECLTGVRPFAGESLLAARAKVLLADAPRLAQMLPGAPADLDALCAALLCKTPAGRPDGAAAVARALADLDGAAVPARPSAPPVGEEDPTLAAGHPLAVVLLPAGDELPPVEARLHALADGRTLVVLRGAWSAAEHAERAARLALALRAARPRGPIYVSLAAVGGGSALADALGRTVAEVEALIPFATPTAGDDGGETVIWLDPTVRGLLGDGFEVRERGGRHALAGTR